jgi:hypothetical protein
MDPEAILYRLTHAEGLSEQAIRAAGERRDVAAPALVDFVERYLAGETSARDLEAEAAAATAPAVTCRLAARSADPGGDSAVALITARKR